MLPVSTIEWYVPIWWKRISGVFNNSLHNRELAEIKQNEKKSLVSEELILLFHNYM